jgi:hypothetical protein
MHAKFALDNAIVPALKLLPGYLDSEKARVMLVAIGWQESRFTARKQHGGPARGFWQFEEGGGVRGVWKHSASTELARLMCRARDCTFETRPIWHRLETDDILAAAFARLLLLTDPKPLPDPDDEPRCWDYYERNWKPGKPHPETWSEAMRIAREMVL